MTEKIDDGGPAFPVTERQEHLDGAIVCAESGGLTKREWFAGMASDSDIWEARNVFRNRMGRDGTRAELRYFHADAMIAEGKKK